MKLFKSHDPNTFHYTTSVCYRRVPVFRSDEACNLLIEALAETRRRLPLKLIGLRYHAGSHTFDLESARLRYQKRYEFDKEPSARQIIDWLREFNYQSSLRKLALDVPQKRGHTHAVWQKDFSSIDLWSPKFIRQKLNYIHLNPVRARLCKHPAEMEMV